MQRTSRRSLSALKEMFRTWSIYRKLVLSNVFYSIPVMGLIYLMVAAQNVNISFTIQEQKGNQSQRPMERLFSSLNAARAQSGANRVQAVNAIPQQFDELKKSLARYGDDLQYNEEGLKKRNRSQIELKVFGPKLEEFLKNDLNFDEKTHGEKVTSLIADVRTMIAHIGDTSNLILDPDLDSYYLMDVTLVALPQTQDRISEIKSFLVNHKTQLTPEDRIQVAVYSALLKQSDLDRITGDVQTTLNEDANFYGVSPTLKTNLVPAIADYQAKTEALIAALNAIASGKNAPGFDQFQQIADNALDASFKSWDIGVEELDTLLRERIRVLSQERTRSLIFATLALLLAVFVLYWVSISFTSRMKFVVDSLSGAMSLTRNNSNELVTLSDSLSVTNNEQCAALDQTSSAMHQISSMIKATKDNALETLKKVESSQQQAMTTKTIMETLRSAIYDIDNASKAMLDHVKKNQTEVSEITTLISDIGNKTKVIDDIVFQTKLLSFNASVEAARAGESGKGFAVVAEEVGSLAQMSGTASKEITNKLGTSITRVNEIASQLDSKVGDLIQLNHSKVQAGERLVIDCDRSVSSIIEAVQNILANSESICTATEEQAKGLEEVARALVRLESVARDNSQISEKTSAQSKQLAQQAESIESIVKTVQEAIFGSAA